MPFPDAKHAVVTQEKFRDYLLNPIHPVAGSKAKWFASLGYTHENWKRLRDDLQTLQKRCPRSLSSGRLESQPVGRYAVGGLMQQ